MNSISQTKLNRFIQDISDIKIQGATAVADATLNILLELISSSPAPTSKSDWYRLEKLADKFSSLRPTEPMARNLSHWLLFELKKRYYNQKSKQENWVVMAEKLNQESKYLLKEIESNLAQVGERLVRAKQIIFTHCHSSLAESILIRAKRNKKKFKVYHTETRPLYQGRITSRHLRSAGVESVMVADSAAAWLVSKHSGDQIDVSWVLLGADSLSLDGSVINKIGSFAIALSAYDSGIPVYIASSLLKIDAKGNSKIELRAEKEIWPEAPKGTKIVNYAFDRVPAKYISGIITELGVLKPKEVAKVARKKYPWVFKIEKR